MKYRIVSDSTSNLPVLPGDIEYKTVPLKILADGFTELKNDIPAAVLCRSEYDRQLGCSKIATVLFGSILELAPLLENVLLVSAVIVDPKLLDFALQKNQGIANRDAWQFHVPRG